MWLDILTGTILIIAILKGYKNGFINFFLLLIHWVEFGISVCWMGGQSAKGTY